jgi:hypothetical protein
MPICPNCRTEYRPGFTRCSDCQADLVETLAEETGEQPFDGDLELVELALAPTPMHAQMIQEMLEENGIVSVLRSDWSAGAGSYTASPNALLVRKEDFPKAFELYEQYFAGDQPAAKSAQDEAEEDDAKS